MQARHEAMIWVKEISLQLRDGHAESFWNAQKIWNRENARCEGYIGTLEARPTPGEALLLVFWRSRDDLAAFMATVHDQIEEQAASHTHYESIRVREYAAKPAEAHLAEALQST